MFGFRLLKRSVTLQLGLLLPMLTPLYLYLLIYFGDDERSHDPLTGMIVLTVAYSAFIFAFACWGHGLYRVANKNAPRNHGIIGNALLSSIPSFLLFLGVPFIVMRGEWLP